MSAEMRPLDVPRRLLMGSGPSNPEPRVLQALASAPLASDDPASAALVRSVDGLIREVFQAPTGCATAVAGASRAGIEAVLASAIEAGDRVVVGVYGHFGELLCAVAQRHGATVVRVEAEWGKAVELSALASVIRVVRPKVVAIVHADTSTGVLQPLDGLGAMCREVGALLVVDAVLSIGGCEVAVDAWGVDAAIGGLQKCLGGPPGMALVSCSTRFAQHVAARATAVDGAYLDLSGDGSFSASEGASGTQLGLAAGAAPVRPTGFGFAAGMAVPHMLFAAREALRMVLDEGLAARWQRHLEASRRLRAGLQAMGMPLFGDPATRVPMITLVPVPHAVDEAGVRAQLLEEHGIEIMAAFGPLRGRVWRIGTMGTNACVPSVLAVLAAFEAVLASRGVKLPRGAAVAAALAAK